MNRSGSGRSNGSITPLVACAGAGFLLAVLWFDLMFDVQVLGQGRGLLAEATLQSMAAYYRRVTTDSWPMGALLPLTMLATIGATLRQLFRNEIPRPAAIAALVLVTLPVALALGRVLPNAVRLGGRADTLDVQSQLARAICWDHLFCFVSVAMFLALQIALCCTTRPGGFPPERVSG